MFSRRAWLKPGPYREARGEEHRLKSVLLFTESATENRPPAERSTVAVAQGNLSDANGRSRAKARPQQEAERRLGSKMLGTLGKGEKVG